MGNKIDKLIGKAARRGAMDVRISDFELVFEFELSNSHAANDLYFDAVDLGLDALCRTVDDRRVLTIYLEV